MQIFVLGMHRSGTSATARLINMMGTYFGPEGSALIAPDNPKGHWERLDIIRLNDALLKLQECKWHDLSSWQFERALEVPDEIRQSMQRLMLNLDTNRPWFLKDPRFCLTLPAWLPLLEIPIAILVYRDPVEIAISLKKRNAIPLEFGLALWEYYAVGMLNATRSMPRLFVQHAQLLQEPMATCERLHQELTALGVQRITIPTAHEIEAFIDPTLYRSKPTSDISLPLTDSQHFLSDMLQGLRTQIGRVEVSSVSRNIIQTKLS